MKNQKNYEKPAYYPEKNWPISSFFPFDVDPFGSYTGVPEEELDQPVQDADDL